MQRSISFIVAAAMAVTGAIASFAPAQAAPARVAPAVTSQGPAEAGIVQVHGRKWRGQRRYDRSYSYYPKRKYYRYPKYYRDYGYYKPRRYYRSRPGITFGFSFGTPHYRW